MMIPFSVQKGTLLMNKGRFDRLMNSESELSAIHQPIKLSS